MDKRAEWVCWGVRQLANGEEVRPNIYRGVDLWDEAYWCVHDLILDQFPEEDMDTLVESIKLGDIAIMAGALALGDEEWLDIAVEKLIKRFDRRLAKMEKERVPYFESWFGTREEDYRSDAEW